MRLLMLALFLSMVTFICFAQTPGVIQPPNKVDTGPDLLEPYDPPPMVLIPAGEYEMGDHHDGMSDALPVHVVYINDFHIGICEITNAEFAAGLNWANAQGRLITVTNGAVFQAGSGVSNLYCDTTTSSIYSRITWNGVSFGVVAGKKDHPMVRVSWYGAAAYANWRSAREGLPPCYDLKTWTCNFGAGGYRLPTEAEWEKAARGKHCNPYCRYPWGDALDGSKANYLYSGDPYETGPYPWSTPVGYYDGNQVPQGADMANGYGLYDLAGNVIEWCNDWHSWTYYSSSPYDNPKGPSSGTDRVVRGGSWGESYPIGLGCACRTASDPSSGYSGGGFRLVLD